MSAALVRRPVEGELVLDVSFALSAALASAQAALREARRLGLPTPLDITATAAGVHATAPLDDVLEWQRLLHRPRIAAADYHAGLIRIEGEFDGQTWTLTSMQHRHITAPRRNR
jgi:hypothetical protein